MSHDPAQHPPAAARPRHRLTRSLRALRWQWRALRVSIRWRLRRDRAEVTDLELAVAFGDDPPWAASRHREHELTPEQRDFLRWHQRHIRRQLARKRRSQQRRRQLARWRGSATWGRR